MERWVIITWKNRPESDGVQVHSGVSQGRDRKVKTRKQHRVQHTLTEEVTLRSCDLYNMIVAYNGNILMSNNIVNTIFSPSAPALILILRVNLGKLVAFWIVDRVGLYLSFESEMHKFKQELNVWWAEMSFPLLAHVNSSCGQLKWDLWLPQSTSFVGSRTGLTLSLQPVTFICGCFDWDKGQVLTVSVENVPNVGDLQVHFFARRGILGNRRWKKFARRQWLGWHYLLRWIHWSWDQSFQAL